MATITPRESMNGEDVALAIRQAIKGTADKTLLLNELTSITNAQRQEVALHYKRMYGMELIDDLKAAFSSKLEDGIVALMLPPAEYDARELKDAMTGVRTDEATISEILTSRTPEQLMAIKLAYTRIFGTNLEHDVSSKSSGSLRSIYTSILSGGRSDRHGTDREKAARDARELYEAGEEKRWRTDKSEFNRVFMTSSDEQLQLVSEEYLRISELDLAKAIEKELSGDTRFAYLALLQNSRSRPMFFAQRTHDAFKGVTTDYATLIRVAVSRSEIDLRQIESAFIGMYGKKMSHVVKEKAHGSDFKTFMLAVYKEEGVVAG